MDWMYLFYFSLALLMFFGAKSMGRGNWNEEFTSLKQTKILQGITILGIALHHMGQKTCAPWHPSSFTVHGLDVFVPIGYLFVAVFLFCSGLGLYKSLHTKPDYLKGFFRRRILPIIIAFYLSEWIHTAVRLLMGQKMDLTRILWYLSGLHMANPNAWYLVVIPFFYLAFWAAFRFCRREGFAIFCVFVFTLAYTVLGAYIGHQDDWWMQGEWWYNSIILFPVGILFARFEKPVTRFFRKGYWFWLLLSFAGIFLLLQQSEWLNNNVWGYYDYSSRMRIPHSLMSAGVQWLVCLFYVTFCFLLMMKVRLGNRILAWLGSVTLEFYLMHGIFVELFGYNFLDIGKSLVYIRKVPLYIPAVLGSAAAATLLFRWILKKIVDPLSGNRNKLRAEENKKNKPDAAVRKEKIGKIFGIVKKLVFPVLFLAVALVMLFGFRKSHVRTVDGLVVTPPAGYDLSLSDTRYVIWEYKGNDKKPSRLILDEEIRGDYAQKFDNADAVFDECYWLSGKELYVTPNGIRTVRGFCLDEGGISERRYYVEGDKSVFLISMKEDDRYYNRADCEAAIQETVDGIRRK